MTNKRVLIVDDSATVRQQVAQALTGAGFEVIEATDGQLGLEAIENDRSISAVVCDLNMPRLSGIEVLRAVKSQPDHAQLPILMLTTDGHPALMKQAKELGARGWIVKPFKAQQLIGAVQKLMAVAASSSDKPDAQRVGATGATGSARVP